MISKIFFLILFVFSFGNLYCQKNDDYLILDNFISKIKIKKNNDSIFLDSSRSNSYVVSKISELNETFTDKIKYDSLITSYGIGNNKIFKSIFNRKEFHFLISQKDTSIWDFAEVKDCKVLLIKKNEKNNPKLFISKPIYTKNNKYALVMYSQKNESAIIVYRKMKNSWEEYKIICPMILNKKVELFE